MTRIVIYYCLCLIPLKRIDKLKVELNRKKCKTTIVLYCFHTAGVLHTFRYLTFWALEYLFLEQIVLEIFFNLL